MSFLVAHPCSAVCIFVSCVLLLASHVDLLILGCCVSCVSCFLAIDCRCRFLLFVSNICPLLLAPCFYFAFLDHWFLFIVLVVLFLSLCSYFVCCFLALVYRFILAPCILGSRFSCVLIVSLFLLVIFYAYFLVILSHDCFLFLYD